MDQTNFSSDTLSDQDFAKPTIPSGLNVLTILTFIGCAVFGIFTIITPWFTGWMLKIMDKTASSGQEFSAKQLADMEKSRHLFELTQANMWPTVGIGIVGIALCFVGALMMRKLKKDGFWLYIAGQIVPLLGSFILIGTAQYTSPWSFIGLLFPLGFIILYATQRKYFVN